jgi:hypothetical protein
MNGPAPIAVGRMGFEFALSGNALAKRLQRRQDERVQFALAPGLSTNNNLAEGGIRLLVVICTIGGGSYCGNRTKTRMTLASRRKTYQVRGHNSFT